MTGNTETNSERIIKHTHEEVNLSGLPLDSPIRELVLNLSCAHSYMDNSILESVMEYDRICNHNDGYLCEHRLQFIVDFLNKKMTKK